MKISSIYASLFAIIIIGSAVNSVAAQTAPPAEVTEFKFSFEEEVLVNTFNDGGDTLVGFNQTLVLDLSQDISLDLSIPVYTQGSNTSVGDIDLGGTWEFLHGDNTAINKWNVSVGGGVFIPVGSDEFRSSAVNPYISAGFDCKVWVLDFSQTADYRFNGGESYITWIGTKTDSDVLNLGTSLSHAWGAFDFGVNMEQVYYVDGDNAQVLVGPIAEWEISSNVDLNASYLLPVYQDVTSAEVNAVFTAGLSIKF